MDHGYFKDRLSAFIDQELTPEETRALTEHLEECAECREELARLKAVDRLVEEHSGLDGEDYFEKSARKIEQHLGLEDTTVTDIAAGRKPKHSGLWWKIPSIAASAAVLIFIGMHGDDIFNASDLKAPSEIHEGGKLGEPGSVVADSAESRRKVNSLEASSPASAEIQDKEQGAAAADKQDVAEEAKSPARVGIPKPSAPVPSVTRNDGGTSEGYLSEEQEAAPSSVQKLSAPVESPPPPPPSPSLKQKTKSESNYRRTPPPQTTTGIDKSVEVQGADEASGQQSEAFDEDMASSVTYWIYRRDSLMQLSQAEEAKAKARQSLRTSGVTSLAPSSAPTDSTTRIDKLESQLLETWYWIALLSTDSSEVTSARAALTSAARDTASVNNVLASDYLKRLGNK